MTATILGGTILYVVNRERRITITILTGLQEGTYAKWAIFFGLLFVFFAFILGGRMHAMKRINKGLLPLSYHRVRSCCFTHILINNT